MIFVAFREWLKALDLALQMRESQAEQQGNNKTCFFVRGERNMLSAIMSKISELEDATTSVEGEFDTPTVGPLMIEASGDPDFPFYVCPVDGDGIQLPPVAAFEKHADALRFAAMNHPPQRNLLPR